MKRSKKQRVFQIFSVVVLVLSLLLSPAMAAAAVELATTYPGITAGSGEVITFPLEVVNNGSQSRTVSLQVEAVPEGWQAAIEGRGREINQVYVFPQAEANADLKVQVPRELEEGVYTVTVSASSGETVLDRLHLQIKVSQEPAGDDQLKAQYSELKGSADASFNYKLTLTNNSNEEQVYSLGADLPQGWQISFKPSYEQQEVASIPLAAGQSVDLNVSINPAPGVEAGEYEVDVYAVSALGQVSERLTLIVSGSYRMEYTTASERLNTELVAGQERKITMVVRNTGSAPLNNIRLSAQTPKDWNVSYDLEKIDFLKPGEEQQVTATITASSKAIAGDYALTLTAYADEIRKVADMRVTVKTSTWWGLVGIVIVILVCGGVYWIFRKYGRR
ncbi:MAG: alpha-galactosidase [Firmicutes bacterium]|nr:alpha-galactosidase [Bacillota bacterium]